MAEHLTKAIEVLATGNLAKLNDSEKTQHYVKVCESMGLNPLTRPFEYITLNGKLTLYARKDATDQLRRINGVSIEEPKVTFQDTWIIVTVIARDRDGRTDADVGVVSKTDMQGNYGNALMKAITKAKRRVTLSICGLGMLDESEVDTIPNAHVAPASPPALPPSPPAQQQQRNEQPRQQQQQAKTGLNRNQIEAMILACTGTKDKAWNVIKNWVEVSLNSGMISDDDKTYLNDVRTKKVDELKAEETPAAPNREAKDSHDDGVEIQRLVASIGDQGRKYDDLHRIEGAFLTWCHDNFGCSWEAIKQNYSVRELDDVLATLRNATDTNPIIPF